MNAAERRAQRRAQLDDLTDALLIERAWEMWNEDRSGQRWPSCFNRLALVECIITAEAAAALVAPVPAPRPAEPAPRQD